MGLKWKAFWLIWPLKRHSDVFSSESSENTQSILITEARSCSSTSQTWHRFRLWLSGWKLTWMQFVKLKCVFSSPENVMVPASALRGLKTWEKWLRSTKSETHPLWILTLKIFKSCTVSSIKPKVVCWHKSADPDPETENCISIKTGETHDDGLRHHPA